MAQAKVTFLKPWKDEFLSPVLATAEQVAIWHRVDYDVDTPIDDTTGTRGATPDVSRKFTDALPTKEATAFGTIFDQTAGTIGRNDAITTDLRQDDNATLINIHPYDWVINRRWPLVDATGGVLDVDNGSEKEWHWELPITIIRLNTWVTSGGPDWDAAGGLTGDWANPSISIKMDLLGTIACSNSGTGTAGTNNLRVQSVRSTEQFKGGLQGVEFTFLLNGILVYTAGDSDWSIVFDDSSAPKEPPRGTTTLTSVDGDGFTGTAIAHDVTIQGTRRRGGAMRCVVRHRFDVPD